MWGIKKIMQLIENQTNQQPIQSILRNQAIGILFIKKIESPALLT